MKKIKETNQIPPKNNLKLKIGIVCIVISILFLIWAGISLISSSGTDDEGVNYDDGKYSHGTIAEDHGIMGQVYNATYENTPATNKTEEDIAIDKVTQITLDLIPIMLIITIITTATGIIISAFRNSGE